MTSEALAKRVGQLYVAAGVLIGISAFMPWVSVNVGVFQISRSVLQYGPLLSIDLNGWLVLGLAALLIVFGILTLSGSRPSRTQGLGSLIGVGASAWIVLQAWLGVHFQNGTTTRAYGGAVACIGVAVELSAVYVGWSGARALARSAAAATDAESPNQPHYVCDSCGSEWLESYEGRFCADCGSPLRVEAKDADQGNQAVVVTPGPAIVPSHAFSRLDALDPATHESTELEATPQKPWYSRRLRWVAMLVVALGLGVAFVFPGGSSPRPSLTSEARHRLLAADQQFHRAVSEFNSKVGGRGGATAAQIYAAGVPFASAVNRLVERLRRIDWPSGDRAVAGRVENDLDFEVVLLRLVEVAADRHHLQSWTKAFERADNARGAASNSLRRDLGLPPSA